MNRAVGVEDIADEVAVTASIAVNPLERLVEMGILLKRVPRVM